MKSINMNTTEFSRQSNVMTNSAIMSPPSPTEATTANEAAAIMFPNAASLHAFWEKEAPMSESPTLEILDLVDEFWALTIGPLGNPERPVVFVTSENQFRRFNQEKGIYEPISDSAVSSLILKNLELCAAMLPRRVKIGGFMALKNRQRMKPVVEIARDLLAVDDDFFQERKPYHLALPNGVLRIDTMDFQRSAPSHAVRETLPTKYDPKAKCDVFLNCFLAKILAPADIDLLQRYLSQVLEGVNHSQKILVLNGEAGWGKSSLMKILGSIVGWENVGIVREALFKDEFELAFYSGKHLLFHPDMPTDFLDRKGASVFKQLVGGDPLWANVKGTEGRIVLQGNFPVILACNGTPRIHIDEDADAWLRRLVVVSFKAATHDQHFGKLADMIVNTESSGVLNWVLEGRRKLFRDKLQLNMTTAQENSAANLLLASQSPAAFVQSRLEKKKDSEISAVELYSRYQEWCRNNNVRPFASQAFTKMAKEEIELKLGLRYRHDLGGEQGTSRGWKGVGLVEMANLGRIENASAKSEGSIRGSVVAHN